MTDVNSNVTPTTGQKVENVTPDKWHEMNIDQLVDQRIILNNRMIMAQQSGHIEIALQVNKGVIALDAILQKRSTEMENEGQNKINDRSGFSF